MNDPEATVWRVSYEDLEWKRGMRPFYKNQTEVTAISRKDAIGQVQGMFAPPQYGNYRASKVSRGDSAIP